MSHAFRARLQRPEGVGTWTYFEIPFDAAAEWGARGRIAVKGSVNGVPIRRSIMPDGNGGHFMPLNKDILAAGAVAAGDEVDVVLEPDADPRTVDVPEELERALAADPRAQAAFDTMAPSHQREYATYVAEAKKAETRDRRARKSVGMLRDGAKLKS